MTKLERLKQCAMKQHQENQLPDELLQQILALGDHPAIERAGDGLIEKLLDQIENYDPYAGIGCFCDAASATSIATTIRQLQEGLR